MTSEVPANLSHCVTLSHAPVVPYWQDLHQSQLARETGSVEMWAHAEAHLHLRMLLPPKPGVKSCSQCSGQAKLHSMAFGELGLC